LAEAFTGFNYWGVVINKDPQNKPLKISPSDLYYRRSKLSVATAGGLKISPSEPLSWALRGVNNMYILSIAVI
jgi:hypothetical protein